MIVVVRRLLLLGLVACYRPASYDDCKIQCTVGVANDCPAGLDCVDGRCTSATQCVLDGGDIVTDAPPMLPPACTIGAYQFDLGFAAASHADFAKYTTNMTRTLAVFERESADVTTVYEPRSGPVDTFPLQTPIKANDGDVFHAGVLSPDGDEVFLQNTRPQSVELAIVAGAGAWETPRRMRVFASGQEVVLDALDFPGTPMAHSAEQRRMMIQNNLEFWELVEAKPSIPPDRWDVGNVYTAASFGFQYIEQPQLSPDGLRLVFRGQLAGQPIAVFGITRAMRGIRFGNNTVKLVDTTFATHPFLSADCEYLYVWNNTTEYVLRYTRMP